MRDMLVLDLNSAGLLLRPSAALVAARRVGARDRVLSRVSA